MCSFWIGLALSIWQYDNGDMFGYKVEVTKRDALLATVVVIASLAMEKSCGPVSPAHAEPVRTQIDVQTDAICESNDLVIIRHIGGRVVGDQIIDNSPFCITPAFPPATAQQLAHQDEEWLTKQFRELLTPSEPTPAAPAPPALPPPEPGMTYAYIKPLGWQE